MDQHLQHSLAEWFHHFQDVLIQYGTDQKPTSASPSQLVHILSSTVFQFLQTASASVPIFSTVNKEPPTRYSLIDTKVQARTSFKYSLKKFHLPILQEKYLTSAYTHTHTHTHTYICTQIKKGIN